MLLVVVVVDVWWECTAKSPFGLVAKEPLGEENDDAEEDEAAKEGGPNEEEEEEEAANTFPLDLDLR